MSLRPLLQHERHPPVPNPQNLGLAAVAEPESLVVAGPADAVAGAKLDRLCMVDLGSAPPPADLRRLPGNGRAVGTLEMHGPVCVIDALDTSFVTLRHAQTLVGAVEGDHVAGA